MHDRSVCRTGIYDKAVAALKLAKEKGFRVTINCTIFNNAEAERVADFFDTVTAMGVDGITVSPGYAYERAPDQKHFLNRRATKELFRGVFRRGRGGKAWPINQSGLFIDFLAGNQEYHCTPWGNPTRTVFGWQRPCYLLGEGYTKTFKELMEETEWEKYGTGNYEKCADCMVHCGYEASAVTDTVKRPWKAALGGASGCQDRRSDGAGDLARSTSGRPNTSSHATSPRSSRRFGRPRPIPRRSRQRLRARKLARASPARRDRFASCVGWRTKIGEYREMIDPAIGAESVGDHGRHRARRRVADDPERGEHQAMPRGEGRGHMRFHVDGGRAGLDASAAALASASRSGASTPAISARLTLIAAVRERAGERIGERRMRRPALSCRDDAGGDDDVAGARLGSSPPAIPKESTARQPGTGRAASSVRSLCVSPPEATATSPGPSASRISFANPVTIRIGNSAAGT